MKPLTRWASAVFNLFRWFQRRFGRIFPRLAKIKMILGASCSLRTLRRALAELVAGGLLWRTRRYHRSSVYSLTPPELSAQMDFEFAGGYSISCPSVGTSPVVCEKPAQSAGLTWDKGSDQRKLDATVTSTQVISGPPASAFGPRVSHLVTPPSLKKDSRQGFVPLVVFLTPVQARRKPPRRQTGLHPGLELFLREG